MTGPGEPLRVIVVGAGGMGRAWLSSVCASREVELAGIVDLNVAAAQAAAIGCGRFGIPVGVDLVELARAVNAQAVIDVTVPEAHHPVTTAALFAGLPVLGEKPVAENVGQALSLAAAAEITGELFMVSQSRRWNPQLWALRAMTRRLGAIGTLSTDFFRSEHFGGFREQMPHPLLVDMAIHAFDSARFLLGAEPVSAYCEDFNPPWSWYSGAASATAVFEMTGGTRYVYNGSWCSPGAETSWNGVWRVSGEKGAALWNGDDGPAIEGEDDTLQEAAGTLAEIGGSLSGIDSALHAFVHALRTGEIPSGEVHENLMSLAMVEAAVESAGTGRRIRLDNVLAQAHAQALRDEPRADVRERLTAWSSVRGALARTIVPATPAASGRGTREVTP